jgi:hypothetical protein
MTDEELQDSGQSDSSSGSNTLTNILDTASKLGTTAGQVYSQVAGNNPLAANTQARQAAAPAAPINWQKYLPWGIGAVVLLVVLGIVFRRK